MKLTFLFAVFTFLSTQAFAQSDPITLGEVVTQINQFSIKCEDCYIDAIEVYDLAGNLKLLEEGIEKDLYLLDMNEFDTGVFLTRVTYVVFDRKTDSDVIKQKTFRTNRRN
ncbi:MAG: hypothetical protein KDD46_05160 [Bdellovibrionales bacterium]|nr:hypothetical protein [Bdellovibrionales bacterium]